MKTYLILLSIFIFLAKLVCGQVIVEDRTRVFQQVPFLGHTSTEVFDIAEDSVGYLWFASASGIYRWDGGVAKLFQLTINQGAGMVNTVTVDRSGNVWASNYNGIYVLRNGTDQFAKVDLADSVALLTHQHIRAMRCGTDGNIWADTESGFLLCINTKTFTFQSFKHKKPEIEGDYFYHNISFDADGNVWIKGRNLEITRFEPKSRKFTVFAHPGTDDGGILTVNGQSWYGAFPFNRATQKFDLNPRFSIRKRIHTMCADHTGRIWLGGSESGLFAFDPKSTKVSHFAHEVTDDFSLLSNTINKLFCDHEGNIWIATDKGVCFLPWYYRFVENYRGNHGSGFSESAIQCAIERKNGEWWLGTETNGVLHYNPKTGQSGYLNYQLLKPSINESTFEKEREVLKRFVDFGLVQLPDRNGDRLTLDAWRKSKFTENNESNVNALFEDKNGDVWIGLYNHVGFNRFSDSDGFKRFGLFYQPDLFYHQPLWGANWYMDFAEDKKSNFWVATWEGFGLNLFNRQTGQFEGKHFMPIDKPYDARILHHALLNDSLALIGGFRYLGLYNFRRNTFQHLKTDQFHSNKHWNELLKYDSSSKTTRTQVPPWIANVGGIQKAGANVWFITDGGLGKLDCRNLRFEIIDLGGKVVFNHYYVGSLAATESKVWFSNGSGLYCYDVFSKNIADYSSLIKNSFPDFNFMNIVKLFMVDPARLLLGTTSGIFLFDIATNKIREIGLNLPLKVRVINILKYRDKTLVCCVGHSYIFNNDQLEDATNYYNHFKSFEGRTIFRCADITDKEECFATDYGLFHLSPNESSPLLKRYSMPSGSQNIDDVFFLPDQRMILSYGGGLFAVSLNHDTINNLAEIGSDRLSNRLLSKLFVDSNDNIWVGNTENGIDVLRMPAGEVVHFSGSKCFGEFEQKCRINGICETKSEHIWAASSKGLLHFDHYKIADTIKLSGLSNTEILSVLPDEKGNLWMGTASGLWIYSPDKKKLNAFSQFYHLGIAGMGKACTKLSDGRLLFSGGKQVIVIDPRLLEHKVSSHRIVIEAVKINGSNQVISLISERKVKLSYKQNSLSVQFSLIGFNQTDNQLIAFRINNQKQDWQFLDASERQIRFESLQPGDYSIQLQPVDKQLHPIGDVAVLNLEIVPPFWQRPWVRSFVVTILLIATILLFWAKNRLSRLRERKMQQVIDAQTSDLRSTAQSLRILLKDREKFMSIVSHDLKNPVKGIERLSSTLNQTWQGLDDDGRKRLFDELHKTSSGASKLLEHLLKWSVQKQGLNQPGWEEISLFTIVSEVVQEVERSASWKRIQLRTNVDEHLVIRTDREMMSFTLRNLIMNAIKFSYQGDFVEIAAIEESYTILVTVSDHGIGMGPIMIENLFKPGSTIKQPGTDNEKGTGLALIIVKEFIDRLGYSIQVESEECKGATFTILIPHTNGK